MTTVSGGVTSTVSAATESGDIVLFGGTLIVISSGIIVDTDDSGHVFVSAGGTAIDTTVNSGGVEAVFGGGTAIGTVVSGHGTEAIASGGTAIGTVVSSHGTDFIARGGTAIGTIVTGAFSQRCEHFVRGWPRSRASARATLITAQSAA